MGASFSSVPLETETSDADGDNKGASGGYPPGLSPSWQRPLPDEPWMTRSAHEQELWERVRPRALRREAVQIKALRLPVAALSRLMRLHPALQVRSSEALEVITYSTLLIMQAVTRVVVRGKAPGQCIQFEDLRQACLGIRELQFLHPFSCTLDVSAQVMHKDCGCATADGDDVVESVGVNGTAATLKLECPRASMPTKHEADASEIECQAAGSGTTLAAVGEGTGHGGGTPVHHSYAGVEAEQRGSKRRAASSAQKMAKRPVRSAGLIAVGEGKVARHGISSFFRHVDISK